MPEHNALARPFLIVSKTILTIILKNQARTSVFTIFRNVCGGIYGAIQGD